MLRLLKYKTADARSWLQYDKDRKFATDVCCKVFAQFREHNEGIKYFKEDWLSESTNWRLSCPTELITQEPHIKKTVSLLVQYGSSSNYELYIIYLKYLKLVICIPTKYKLVYYLQKYYFKHYF